MSGPTLEICNRATPPSPAMPAPSAKAMVSMREVGTPTQPAIARFWVTARTNMPSRVLFISTQTRNSTNSAKPMMITRFHGRIRLGRSSTPPDIQLGLATSTFCAPNSTRAAWIRISDRPQVASRVSSVRPYSQRITVRSISTPTAAAAKKATGIAAGRYQSTCSGK
ncbi:hypothetical protein SDC9_162406 [bioreactor metagenome]|uniref:Uncharacterized protein n=1 Tax=bioreactor metagenome TaxID=1076179 RepID=A0A645FKY8_9ZZZZ